MESNRIRYDEVDLVIENDYNKGDEDEELYFDYDSEDTSYSEEDSSEDDGNDVNKRTIPEKILDYYMSSSRIARLKYIGSLSLKNRGHTRCKENIDNCNTRRNMRSSKQKTPKRRRNKMKDNKCKYHKKTKRIIFLK